MKIIAIYCTHGGNDSGSDGRKDHLSIDGETALCGTPSKYVGWTTADEGWQEMTMQYFNIFIGSARNCIRCARIARKKAGL